MVPSLPGNSPDHVCPSGLRRFTPNIVPCPDRGRPYHFQSTAAFDVAGAGNVMTAAGLGATAKAVEHPPEPKVGAPVLGPTKPVVTQEARMAVNS
jgi:hypothetical protein